MIRSHIATSVGGSMGPVRRVVPEGSITAGLAARDSANNVLNRGCLYLQEAGSILFEFVMNAPRTYPNSVGCSMHCIYMQLQLRV